MTVTVRKPHIPSTFNSLSMDLQSSTDSAFILFENKSENVRIYIDPKQGPVHNPSIEVTQCINDNPEDTNFFPLTSSKIITETTDMYLKPLTRMLKFQGLADSYGATISLHTDQPGIYYMHSDMSFSESTNRSFRVGDEEKLILPIFSHASLFRWSILENNSSALDVSLDGNWKQLIVDILRKKLTGSSVNVHIRGVPFIRSLTPIEYRLRISEITS